MRFLVNTNCYLKETIRMGSDMQKVTGDVQTEQLERLAFELKKLKKKEEEVIYKISHDLQQPITTMIGYLGLVERRYGQHFDAKGKQFLDNIRLSSEKLSSVLKSLLEYSRIGKFGELESVDCNQIVNDVWLELKTNPKWSQANLTYNDLPVIHGNSYDIYMLFFHLIRNGFLYQQTGSIPEVDIQAKESDTGWTIEVTDNGMGIAEEFQPRIFDLLGRLHSHSDYPGSGVGLALCEKVIENLGGEIRCESKEGEGTRFILSIPS